MSVANFSRWTPGLLKKSSSMTSTSSTPPPPDTAASPFAGSVDGGSLGLRAFGGSTSSLTASTAASSADDFGTLIIVVMKAKNLYNRRAISKQNPYCSVRVAKHSNRTKAITRGGQSPLWDHETRFKLSAEDDNRELKLCVFDQNGSNTEIIGDTVIPLQPAFAAPPDAGYDGWFPIYFNKRYVGEVYLEMTFYPRRVKRPNSARSTPTSTPGSTPQSTPGSTPRTSVASLYDASRPRHSGSVPALHAASLPGASLPERTATPPNRRGSRPLPQVPPLPQATPLPQLPQIPQVPHEQSRSAQEDIQRQINDGYEASLFERLKPSASQPFP